VKWVEKVQLAGLDYRVYVAKKENPVSKDMPEFRAKMDYRDVLA
jgi:hypothetical protein